MNVARVTAVLRLAPGVGAPVGAIIEASFAPVFRVNVEVDPQPTTEVTERGRSSMTER